MFIYVFCVHFNSFANFSQYFLSLMSSVFLMKMNEYEMVVAGTYCNSASACFVASDGKNLRLYQAVVDARKLLDELSDPETSVSLADTFDSFSFLHAGIATITKV